MKLNFWLIGSRFKPAQQRSIWPSDHHQHQQDWWINLPNTITSDHLVPYTWKLDNLSSPCFSWKTETDVSRDTVFNRLETIRLVEMIHIEHIDKYTSWSPPSIHHHVIIKRLTSASMFCFFRPHGSWIIHVDLHRDPETIILPLQPGRNENVNQRIVGCTPIPTYSYGKSHISSV